MADKRLDVSVQLRNDTEANWLLVADTYIPLAGEACVTIDGEHKGQVKFGDGVNTWGSLTYAGVSDVAAAQHFTGEAVGEQLDEDVLLEITKDAVVNSGDTAVITHSFGNDKTSYTAYVYDGEKWAAMDGNYSASNVFIKDNITLSGRFTNIGNYNKGDVINAGTSLESILSNMLQQELYPSLGYDLPSASISVYGGNGEVGSAYTLPTATLTIDDVGSYEYGPETGISFPIGSVSLTQGSNNKQNTTIMTAGSTIKLQATDTETLYTDTAKTYTFTGTATYSDGAVPVTNLGNQYPDAQIKGGDVDIASKTATFSGWRRIFGGGTTAATINSSTVRSLSQLKKTNESVPTTSGGKGIIINATKGSTKVVFAYPSSWTTKTPNFEIFTMAWGSTSGFVESTAQVADYRGGENGLAEYKIYTYTPATPLAADNTQYCVYFS